MPPRQAISKQKMITFPNHGLMSCCQIARLKEMGRSKSTISVTQLHSLCRRAVRGPRSLEHEGLILMCQCACHKDQEWKCLECREIGTNINQLTGVCTNTVACEGRKREAVTQWWANRGEEPIFSGMSDKDRNILEEAGLGPILLTPGQCECCGEDVEDDSVTAFLQGHDKRLKRRCLALACEGDIDALTEMVLRGWLGYYEKNKMAEAFLLKAEEVLGGLDDPIGWALNRTVARW